MKLDYHIKPAHTRTDVETKAQVLYFIVSLYLEVGEGDGPAAGVVVAGHEQGTVALQTADVAAVVGGGGWRIHLAGIEHRLL